MRVHGAHHVDTRSVDVYDPVVRTVNQVIERQRRTLRVLLLELVSQVIEITLHLAEHQFLVAAAIVLMFVILFRLFSLVDVNIIKVITNISSFF